jgi:hypothetical protein
MVDGAVELVLDVDADATVGRYHLLGGHLLLRGEAEKSARHAQINPLCGGQQLRIILLFEIDKTLKPRNPDDGTVILRAPNRIIIRAARFPVSG